MIPEIREGEVYRMRRQHPCGGWEWKVLRTGADVGIECLVCHRHVVLERRKFEARMKVLVARGT